MPAAEMMVPPADGETGELLPSNEQKPMDPAALRQHAVLAFGRRANAQPPLRVLLQDAVALLGEVLHARYCGLGQLQNDSLALVIHDRGEAGAAAREHRCGADDARSMAAFALRNGSLIASADLRCESRFSDPFLESLGAAAALAVPLYVNGKPFGVLTVYDAAPREFTSDEVTFAETIAHLLSASIARIKAEENLQQARDFKSSLLGMVDSMVMTLDMEGRVVDMNRACEQSTQLRLDEVRDRPFWQAMVTPDDADLVRLIFESARGSQIPSQFEGEVVARDGSRRRVCWSLKVLSSGQVQTILVTGRDQTLQSEIKAELQRVRTLAEETSLTLNQMTARLEKTADPAKPPASAPSAASSPSLSSANTKPSPSPAAENKPASSSAAGAEQRRSPRRPYRHWQAIAPLDEKRLPTQAAFFQVEFQDISACGFSFFMEQLPQFDKLVAALGRPPELAHFSARVMRVARITENGRPRYMVGCDFIDRVRMPKTQV